MGIKKNKEIIKNFPKSVYDDEKFIQLMDAYTLNMELTGISDEVLLSEIYNYLDERFAEKFKK